MVYEYTNIGNIISRLKLGPQNDMASGDIIEWIGQVVDRVSIGCSYDNSVLFLVVNNHKASLPPGVRDIRQIAKYNYNGSLANLLNLKGKGVCPKIVYDEIIKDEENKKVTCCSSVGKTDVKLINHSVRYFEIGNILKEWQETEYYKSNFQPVYLTQNTMFNALNCIEGTNIEMNTTSRLEYNVKDTNIITSFKEGIIAVSVYRIALDDTGFPRIPYSEYVEAAIEYYVKYKYNEAKQEANYTTKSGNLVKYNYEMFIDNLAMAKSVFKSRQKLDQLENFNQSNIRLLPNKYTYGNFFSDLSINYG